MRWASALLGVGLLSACTWQPLPSLPQHASREPGLDEHVTQTGAETRPSSSLTSLAPSFDTPPQPAAAQVPQSLTLAAAFRLALAHSEVLQIQGERIFQAETQRRQAIARLLPQVAGHSRYTRDSDVVRFGGQAFTPPSRTDSWLTVRQSLFEANTYPALDVARESHRIEELRLLDHRDRLLFEVAATFYEILSLERDLDALGTSLARSQEHLRVLEVRYRVGESPEQEVLLAQARLDETEARQIQARHDRDRGRSRLARLTGVIPPSVLEDTLQVVETDGAIPRLVDQALSQRLDLEIARLGQRLAEAGKRSARSEYLPRASLDFSHWTDVEGGFTGQIDWTLALSLDWNLFDGGNREARLARALSAVRERELALAQIEKDIRLEVEDAVLALRSLERSLTSFTSRERAASRSAEQAEQRFRAGEATNLDVLVAEEVRQEAERDLARAQLARKLATLRIRLVLGDFHRVLQEKG